MHTHHTVLIPLNWHGPRTLSGFWSPVGQSIRDRWEAFRSRDATATLPSHLRYDIGELDCRPPHPLPRDPDPRHAPIDLETMWRRYGC